MEGVNQKTRSSGFVDIDQLVSELRRCAIDFEYFCEKYLKIQSIDGGIIPFKLNPVQKKLHEILNEQYNRIGKVRAIIVKGRKMGISTYVSARFFHRVIFNSGLNAFIMAHRDDSTQVLFDIVRRFYEYMPDPKPMLSASNPKELVFGRIDSRFMVATAGARDVGRASTIHLFHGSEVAFWEQMREHVRGALQAVPDSPGTEIILESTGNGAGNEFYRRFTSAQTGRSEYIAIFLPYWIHPQYRKKVPPDIKWDIKELSYLEMGVPPEALMWRRAKIINDFDNDELLFMREYPATAEEAFVNLERESLIPFDLVQQAMAREAEPDPAVPLVVGVDPARFGNASTAIAYRRGRVVEKIERLGGLSTMEIVGHIVRIIEQDHPAAVCVDCAGLGGGIVDRLVELGYGNIVIPIYGSSRADEPDRYSNKRAECWARLLRWLQDEEPVLPNDTQLAKDLITPARLYDSRGRLKLESKTSMHNRGADSPDSADALSYTFAVDPTTLMQYNIQNDPMEELAAKLRILEYQLNYNGLKTE